MSAAPCPGQQVHNAQHLAGFVLAVDRQEREVGHCDAEPCQDGNSPVLAVLETVGPPRRSPVAGLAATSDSRLVPFCDGPVQFITSAVCMRLTVLTTALSEADTIDSCRPTPHVVSRSPVSTST